MIAARQPPLLALVVHQAPLLFGGAGVKTAAQHTTSQKYFFGRNFFEASKAAVFVGLLFALSPAHASETAQFSRPVSYAVVDQDVGDVVTGIGAQIGLRTDVSNHVHGHVHGRMTASSAQDTLTRLGQLYGFDWYCDGQTIYVSSYGEAARKVMQLGAVSGDELLHAVTALGVADARWPVRMSPARDIAFVNGPPHYVSLVEETLAALAERTHAGVAEVHVFRGAASGS